MTQKQNWYENKNYKSLYIDSKKKINIEVDNWSATYGIPVINKKFKNYETMVKMYGDDPKRRAFLKIPITGKNSRKKIERISLKIMRENGLKGDYKATVMNVEKYDNYINCKLKLFYDTKKKCFVNLITTDIYKNDKKIESPTLGDVERIMYKSQKTKLVITPKKIWSQKKEDGLSGVEWVIEKMFIEKKSSKLEEPIKEEEESNTDSEGDYEL